MPEIVSLTQHRITVLLVDDQVAMIEAVRRMLSTERDIDFHACRNPAQAIAEANRIAPTVILQDLVMPEVDGLTLLRYFRINPHTRDVPLIVLSVNEDVHIKAEAFTQGANDYMVKFPDRLEVIVRIRHHSNGYIHFLQKNEVHAQLVLSMEKEQERHRELMMLREQLKSETMYDPISGAYNRRYSEESLEREIARAKRHHTQIGLLIVSIDRFKDFNQRYGNNIGDMMLGKLGRCLQMKSRREDIVCRYDGDEFLLILPDISVEAMERRSEDLRLDIKKGLNLIYKNESLSIRVSLGMAVFPGHGEHCGTLIGAAYQAVRLAKQSGGDRLMIVPFADGSFRESRSAETAP